MRDISRSDRVLPSMATTLPDHAHPTPRILATPVRSATSPVRLRWSIQ